MNAFHYRLPTLLLYFAMLFVVCGAGPGLASDDALSAVCQTPVDKAKALVRVGSFQLAERTLRSAIEALPEPGGTCAAVLWNEMGAVHELNLQMDEAKGDYHQSLRLNESLNNPTAIDLAVSYNGLGTLEESNHRFPAAETFFRRSLATLTKAGLDSVPITGSVRTNLAASLQMQGKYGEADIVYEVGLAELKEQFGQNSAEYGSALRNFGLFTFETGRYLKALEVQRQAYRIETSLPFVRDTDKAVTLNNLALTLIEVGSYSEAEPLLRSAIKLQTKSPTVDPRLAESLTNLGILEEKAMRLNEARAFQSEALTIALRTHADNDPLIATIWHNLGSVAASQTRFKEARSMYEKAADTWLKNGGESSNYAATVTSLGTVELRTGHHRKALELYARALRIDEHFLGADHPRVASDLCNVAVEMLRQRKPDQALQHFERAEQIQEMAFGSRNIQVARTWREIGMANVALKNFQQAEHQYNAAIEIARVSSNETPELMSWLFEYADLLKKEQKFGAAEQAMVQAYRIRVRTVISAEKQGQKSSTAASFH